MKYLQLDRITEVTPGKSLTGVRKLAADETYLQDHFPLFPIMPRVLMLEAMQQAGAWLLRVSCGFEEVVVNLVEAKNVKFQDFVEPGMELTVTAEIVKQEESRFTLKLVGKVEDRVASSGRLVMDRFRLGDREPEHAFVDSVAKTELIETFAKLASSISTE